MVQRKVINKLRIQENHITTSHRNPFSSQHYQDGKTRVSEVKKKMMKKSKSFKLSASSINSITQPGKPPTTPKSLHNHGHVRALECSPNYMKSTSCFEARKESRFSSSDHGFSGGKKVVKGSVSKLGVRTLTKATSFKVSRQVSAKKSSREHGEVRRATCSSSLKDSKFPSYLELSHGGTESEGTSVMKVCPYTYCSLNGHHHKLANLPPLKRFLSAKKRALKAQKSAELALPSKDEDFERVGMSFFVEIFVENDEKTGFVSSKIVEEVSIEEEQVVESLCESSPQSEIDVEEALVCVEDGLDGSFDEDEASERDLGCFFQDMEGTERSFLSEDGSDMEWEEGEFSEAEIEDESVSIFGGSLEIENSTSELPEDDGFSNCDVEMEEQFVEENACFGDEFAEQEAEKIDRPCEDLSSREASLGEGNKESNVSEKTEKRSDTGKQVDYTFDLTSESRAVLEEAEEGNKAAKVSEIKEEANDENAEVLIVDGLDDLSDSRLNVSSMKEDSSSRNKHQASRVDHEIGDEELRNKWSIGKRRSKDSDEDEERKFNPREPNYLPLVENPEGEKVDLKHQEIDERKNSEDWMIDHALQQAVTKLGPARKRRVALLVEAFETVSPINKFETRQVNRLHQHHHLHHPPTSPVFSHAIRPIQACN